MKLWKAFIKVGSVLLIIVAAVLVVRAVFNFVEGRRLTAALADLKARGVPIAAQDLAAPCPDEDNAARLWKAAEDLTTFDKSEDRMLVARAWTDYAAGRAVAPADMAALPGVVQRNQRVLELVTEMTARPCFLYRAPSTAILMGAKLGALKMIYATRLMGFESLIRAQRGDVGPSLDLLRTGLKFTPLVAREGALMPYLIAVADTRMLAGFLNDVCRGRAVGDDLLRELIGEVDPAPWRERLVTAVRGERIVFVEAGQYLLKSGFRELEDLYGKLNFFKTQGAWIIRPLLKRDMRKALPIFAAFEEQASRPYYESRAFWTSGKQALLDRPWYAFVSKAMLADFESAFLKGAMVEAMLTAARTGLACRLFKSRTGRYPEGLSELVPDILSGVPIDPFTGKPLVYRRDGEGFIVYSLGANQKDDGGRSTFMITQLVMPKDDDWAWREER